MNGHLIDHFSKMEGKIEMELSKNYDYDNVIDINQTCRICASVNEYLIPIYDGEGVEHCLASKINQYLPISVTETDELSRQLCYQCASLLITWHEMFIGSLKAEEELRKLKMRLESEEKFQVDECSKYSTGDSENVISGETDQTSQNKRDVIEPKLVEIKYTKIEPLKLPDYSNFTVCKICGECINTLEEDMEEHEAALHGIKPGRNQNVKLKKEKNMSCICEFCGKVFDSGKKAAYHRRYTHMKPARGIQESWQKVCEICGAVLATSKKLREHKRNKHVTVRNHECVVCSMRFKLKETLVNHQRCLHNVFIGEKYQPSFHRPSYPCFLCGIELASKFSLRRHLLVKHNYKTEEKWSFKLTTYNCNHCDRAFKNRISLLRHQDKILNGQIEKKFKCDLCPKGFFCHTDFTRHHRTHFK